MSETYFDSIIDTDLAWLAGYLEGEGCFYAANRHKSTHCMTPTIRVQATDSDVVCRAAELMDCSCRMATRPTTSGKGVYYAEISGARACELMGLLRQFMGKRRGAKIDEILRLASEREGVARGSRCGQAKLTAAAVVEIRKALRTPRHGLKAELARSYGVSQACIWFVLNGYSWKHVA